VIMNTDLKQLNSLRKIEEEVAAEVGVRVDTLARMLAKVEEYSESRRAQGLPDDLLNILKDDIEMQSDSKRG
jgi:DNA sulfur modification protein DndC